MFVEQTTCVCLWLSLILMFIVNFISTFQYDDLILNIWKENRLKILLQLFDENISNANHDIYSGTSTLSRGSCGSLWDWSSSMSHKWGLSPSGLGNGAERIGDAVSNMGKSLVRVPVDRKYGNIAVNKTENRKPKWSNEIAYFNTLNQCWFTYHYPNGWVTRLDWLNELRLYLALYQSEYWMHRVVCHDLHQIHWSVNIVAESDETVYSAVRCHQIVETYPIAETKPAAAMIHPVATVLGVFAAPLLPHRYISRRINNAAQIRRVFQTFWTVNRNELIVKKWNFLGFYNKGKVPVPDCSVERSTTNGTC